MRNKLRKIVGTLLTFAVAFTLFGGEAKAVRAATETTRGWSWNTREQKTGEWGTGAIGGYYREDEVYFKIGVEGFQESDETLNFTLSRGDGYEQDVDIILSEDGSQTPRNFTGTGKGQTLPGGTGEGFRVSVVSPSGAKDHVYTISFLDRARLAQMKDFTIYIKAKMAPVQGKPNSSNYQFALVQGNKTIPFHGAGIFEEATLRINKVLRDYEGVVRTAAQNFDIVVSGPSYPSGKAFVLTNGRDLVLERLAPGTYTITEPDAENRYETAFSPEASLELEGGALRTVTITNTERNREITAKKVWIGGPEEKPVVTLILLQDGMPFGEKELAYPEARATWTVPARDGQGNLYTYTVDEKDLADYEKSVEGFTVTNTYVTVVADVVVKKVDEEGRRLPGAEFTLYQEEMQVGEPVVTGEDGKATFREIPYGTYTLKETKAPEGHVASAEAREVMVRTRETVEETFTNVRIQGTVEIKKVDREDHGKVLPGARFRIVDKAGITVFEGTTDEKGMLVAKLPYGAYVLSEVEAPVDYERTDETWAISIGAHGEVKEILVENEMIEIVEVNPNPLKMGTLRIRKLDKDTDRPLEGVRFTIMDKDGDVVFEGVTDGEGLIEEKLILGDYTIREDEALPGYVPNHKLEKARIRKDGEVVELTILNEKMYGLLRIRKVDAETGEALECAKFRIVDSKGVVILEDYTDEEGMLEVWLPKGRYIVSETEAPQDYILTDETWSVEVTKDKEVFDLLVKNQMIEVLEVSPIALPQTGGIPGESLYLLGTLAILAGMQMTRRRRT